MPASEEAIAEFHRKHEIRKGLMAAIVDTGLKRNRAREEYFALAQFPLLAWGFPEVEEKYRAAETQLDTLYNTIEPYRIITLD